MIDDPKLAQMFRAESGERLAKLDAGLLRLEKAPADPELLEELFREIHSLKGAARMLGLLAVETTAHALESLLNAARKAESPLTPAGIDSLDSGLAKLRIQVEEALVPAPGPIPRAPAGSPPAGSLPAASVQAASVQAAPSRIPPAQDVAAPGTAAPTGPVPPPPAFAPAPAAAPAASEPFHIETVRVETGKLDDLLTLTGELGVLQGRNQHTRALLARAQEQWLQLERQRGQHGRPEGEAAARLGGLLQAAGEGLREDAARFESTLASLQERVHHVRLLPFSTVFDLFPRMLRELGKEQGKEIELQVEGADITVDKRILEEIKDPLMHLLRNAIGHGIEAPEERERLGKPRAGQIRLAAARQANHVSVAVTDDGRGLDLDAIRAAALHRGLADAETLAAMPAAQLQQLVFLPGLSTVSYVTELAGRGVGLDVVRANIERLKGGIRLDAEPGRGTAVTLRLPLSLTSLRLLLVRAGGRRFGLPMDSVRSLRRVPAGELYPLEGRPAIEVDGRPLLAPPLAELLQLPAPAAGTGETVACVVVQVESERLVLQVDEILSEEEVVPRPLVAPLKRVRHIASLATLADGEVCPLLNPADLLRAAARLAAAPAGAAAAPPPNRRSILLVEDSALVRAMEKRIIEGAGYEVVTAVDGADALDKLGGQTFAGVVSDIQMPRLDGLGLTARIRAEARYRDLPVILVTALASDDDRRRGLEVGASAYLPKPSFDQKLLLETLQRLVGP